MENKNKRICERGAIMLEVVAVLSLMGLMGAMLFRQIYKRNQELHNIQMASEIRIVKEAFSAYLQAGNITCSDKLTADPIECMTGVNLPEGIKSYLPDGFFMDDEGHAAGDDLGHYYDFKVFGYLRGPNAVGYGIPTYYGIVIPRSTVLPEEAAEDGISSTWNMRRAARIAMLVGVDGGVYDEDVTGNDISGSMGTWQLANCDEASSCIIDYNKLGFGSKEPPIYVAMTELDVYQPEVDLPDGEINLPPEWDLALRKMHAYQQLSVGGKNGTECYTIKHTTAPGRKVASDTIFDDVNVKNCAPAFWVKSVPNATEGEQGHVYVLNDLHVGTDPANPADSKITLTKKGEILLPELVIDKNGRIISNVDVPKTSAEEDIPQGSKYMLDPGYTSVMNDIRLTSRGGARLSEILPDYILKNVTYCKDIVTRGTPSCIIKGPDETDPTLSCPKGYKWAFVITPHITKTPTAYVGTDMTGTRFGQTYVGFGTTATPTGPAVPGGGGATTGGGGEDNGDDNQNDGPDQGGDDNGDNNDIDETGRAGIVVAKSAVEEGGASTEPDMPNDKAEVLDNVELVSETTGYSVKQTRKELSIKNNPIYVTRDDVVNLQLKTLPVEWKIYVSGDYDHKGTSPEYTDVTPNEPDKEFAIWALATATDANNKPVDLVGPQMDATIQTYCVFVKADPAVDPDDGVITSNKLDREDVPSGKTRAEIVCENLGLQYDPKSGCTIAYDKINSQSACRLVGGTWDGSKCASSSGGQSEGE